MVTHSVLAYVSVWNRFLLNRNGAMYRYISGFYWILTVIFLS